MYLRKLNIKIPYDPTISSWAYIKTKLSFKKTYAPVMFIAALFTIAKTGKPRKCPSTDEWIKKMWYITQWNTTQPQKRTK